MKRTIKSVMAAGAVALLAACGGKSTPDYVSENFLGEVGEAIYSMYDLQEQWSTTAYKVSQAQKTGKKSDVDLDDAHRLAAEGEKAIRHFLETKDNAIGKTVTTELSGEEGLFTVGEPFTVTSIRMTYENEPILYSQLATILTMEAILEPAPETEGEVVQLSLVDRNDSIIYTSKEPICIYSDGCIKVKVELSDYYGTRYNTEGDELQHYNSIILQTKKVVLQVATIGAATAGVYGELGIFDLQGPVKECTVINEWGNVVRTFDENGFWKTHDGKSLSAVYPNGIKRDSEGRIISGKTDSDGNGEEYTYNEMGKITRYHSHFFDDISTETTTYDAEGNILKKHFEYGGLDMIEPYDETYQNIDVDEHGNWTKRKVTSTDGTSSIQKRKITYY